MYFIVIGREGFNLALQMLEKLGFFPTNSFC